MICWTITRQTNTEDSYTYILQNIDRLPNDSLLLTMDVASLYSNIPHKEWILALISFYASETFRNIIHKVSPTLYKSCTTISISTGTIFFKPTIRKEMAPGYANIFTDALERDMLSRYHVAPLHYHRYHLYMDKRWVLSPRPWKTHRQFPPSNSQRNIPPLLFWMYWNIKIIATSLLHHTPNPQVIIIIWISIAATSPNENIQ